MARTGRGEWVIGDDTAGDTRVYYDVVRMDDEMNETGRNKPNTVNSFVIRIWQEFPGQWRGTIRHVQSEAQKAFTTLNQAVQFIDQQTKPVGAASEKKEDAQGLNSLLRLRRQIGRASCRERV